jgi:hypothetical protein
MAAVAPFAAACGAGFNSAAEDVKPNAGAGEVGAVRVNNVWVIVDPATGNAEVIGAVSNSGTSDLSWPTVQIGDNSAQIQAASSSASASADPAMASASASGIPAGNEVSFGEPGAPQIELASSNLTPGGLTQVTFGFGSVGTVTVTAQIQSNTGLFADYNPDAAVAAPGASASASAGATASESASASASASATSSASASASASPTASPSAS